MDKITIKELGKNLKGNIKKTGKKLFSLTKDNVIKLKNGYKNLKEKLVKYVGEETVQEKLNEKIEKKLEKIDEKRDELKTIIDSMEQDERYSVDVGSYYLEEVKHTLKQLDKKRANMTKKGLGVFALSSLMLKKFKDNTKTKVSEYISNIKKEKNNTIDVDKKVEEKSIEERTNDSDKYIGTIKLSENLRKQTEIKRETDRILEIYPELVPFYSELVVNYNYENAGKKL